MAITSAAVIKLMEQFAGQSVPAGFQPYVDKIDGDRLFAQEGGIGRSQLNELLLTLGFDRITPAFFNYVFKHHAHVTTPDELAEGILNFCKDALLLYGNIKFAFKTLGALEEPDLRRALRPIEPVARETYASRARALHRIIPIDAQDSYSLGYIVEGELSEQLKKRPDDPKLLERRTTLEATRDMGRKNHDTYLTYDHMDVYVATSMRERHDFFFVTGFIRALFTHPLIQPLNVRWFDPTQAYCTDRIDKGLVEGLMVKRAKCTIYHVQENDTLGKDSELAATLAQGKPVIAYIPRLADPTELRGAARKVAAQLYPDLPFEQVVMDFLRRYYPEGAWSDPKIRAWIDDPTSLRIDEALDLLISKAQEMYDKRAATLKTSHPLGLQVNLATGVANGVLVVRTVDQCAHLLETILLNKMEFDIEEVTNERGDSYRLVERISGSVFRVATGDVLLTNSFWNFYL